MKLFINQKNNTHIMGICETFLTINTEDSFISIKGFELERKDRCETSEKKGGGVVAYVSSSLKYKRRTDLEISSLESIWLQIHFKNSKSLLICFIYRPPDMPQSWIDEFEKEIEKANELELEMIIMGDINIDFTGGCLNNKWGNVLLTQSIVQLIDTPTRIPSTSSTIIDHVYTNHPENIVETNVPKIALSDHYPVCITRKINQKDVPSLQHKQIRYQCFKNFNENKFLEDMLETVSFVIFVLFVL